MRTMSPAAHRTADRFTARMFRGLWVPAMLSSLGWALSDMADAVVVGQRLGAVTCRHWSDPAGLHDQLHVCPRPRTGRLRSLFPSAESGPTQEAADSFHGVLALALLFSVTTAVLGSVFIGPAAGASGHAEHVRRTVCRHKGLSADPRRGHAAVLPVQRVQLLSAQRRSMPAGAGSVIGNLCDIALNITLVLALDMAREARRCPPRWDRSSPSPSICRAFSVRSTRCAFALPRGRWLRSCPFRAEGGYGHLGAVPTR